MDIHFDEYHSHNSLQGHLTEGAGHYLIWLYHPVSIGEEVSQPVLKVSVFQSESIVNQRLLFSLQ